MTDASVDNPRRPTQRLTPDRVRATRFSRSPIGRRGLSEDEVREFLQRVAEDIAARDIADASLRAQVAHYKNTLLQWQREQSEANIAATPTGDPAATADPTGAPSVDPTVAAASTPRAPVEAVNLLSRAQQEADAYIAQTQEYCRRLAAEAQDHAQEILRDARIQAEHAAERAAKDHRAHAESPYTAEPEDLERRLVWARTFISSLETVETQLRATREAVSYEFDRLGSPPPAPRSAS